MIEAGSERQPATTAAPVGAHRWLLFAGPALLMGAGVGAAVTWSGTAGVVVAVLLANAAGMLAAGILVHGLLKPGRRARRDLRPRRSAVAQAAWSRMTAPARRPIRCAPGDYVVVERALYRVEYLGDAEALAEDCRNGRLTELTRAQLAGARVVPRAGARA